VLDPGGQSKTKFKKLDNNLPVSHTAPKLQKSEHQNASFSLGRRVAKSIFDLDFVTPYAILLMEILDKSHLPSSALNA
jgi:hypothetical protein